MHEMALAEAILGVVLDVSDGQRVHEARVHRPVAPADR